MGVRIELNSCNDFKEKYQEIGVSRIYYVLILYEEKVDIILLEKRNKKYKKISL